MSTQDIQNLYKLISNLQAEVREFIGRSDTKHDHFENHIGDWKGWKDRTEGQLNAIANALLQEQTRDNVEKEAETETERKEEKRGDKWLLWWTTIVVGAFAILSNIGEVVEFLAKILNLLAG